MKPRTNDRRGRPATRLVEVLGTFACYRGPLHVRDVIADCSCSDRQTREAILYAARCRYLSRYSYGVYRLTKLGRDWLELNDQEVAA